MTFNLIEHFFIDKVFYLPSQIKKQNKAIFEVQHSSV